MTIYVIVGILPMFLISPFAGVWADRYNRKNLINISDGAIALVSLVVGIILTGSNDIVWLLFVASALRAFGQGVQMPAVGAFIPLITPVENLTKVNGINASIQSFIQIISPVAGGALLTFMPIQTVFYIDVVTAIIGIVILCCFVKIPENYKRQNKTIDTKPGYFKEIKEGFGYVYKHKFIWHLVLITIGLHILISPSAFLTALQITRDFGKEVWRLTALEVAFSGGMLIGGILIGFWGGFKNKVYTMAMSGFVSGMLTVTLGIFQIFWMYLASMFLIGVFLPMYITPQTVMIQSKVDNNYLGRVMSVFGMVSTFVMPAGMLLFGPLGDVVSIDLLMIITGTLLALLAAPVLLSKSLRQAGSTNARKGESTNARKGERTNE
jgi:DHA3 family macrolide efflux protein-like MFS transporter